MAPAKNVNLITTGIATTGATKNTDEMEITFVVSWEKNGDLHSHSEKEKYPHLVEWCLQHYPTQTLNLMQDFMFHLARLKYGIDDE